MAACHGGMAMRAGLRCAAPKIGGWRCRTGARGAAERCRIIGKVAPRQATPGLTAVRRAACKAALAKRARSCAGMMSANRA
ncbi:MAG: hypothetical protein WDW36_000441 [Sanguina aurantia]